MYQNRNSIIYKEEIFQELCRYVQNEIFSVWMCQLKNCRLKYYIICQEQIKTETFKRRNALLG